MYRLSRLILATHELDTDIIQQNPQIYYIKEITL